MKLLRCLVMISSIGSFSSACHCKCPESPREAQYRREAQVPQSRGTSNPAAANSVAAPDLHRRYSGAPALAVLTGKATYYGDSLSGNRTANGEVYSPRRFTAAHKTLPFNTVVRVIRRDTGRITYVRINDRGPYGDARRIIDLSRVAAEQLEMIRAGVVDVRVEVVEYGPRKR